jgi:WD40 repeat protein
MTTPITTTSTAPQLPTGAWSVALRDQLAKEAIARMGPNASEELKCAVMEQLVQKLTALRDYDLFDPRQMDAVVAKRNYRWVEKVDVGSGANALQVLPDGRVVSLSDDRIIRIWTQGADGEWSSEALRGRTDRCTRLQSLPDGRIMSGSDVGTIRIWTKGVDGEWNSEDLIYPKSWFIRPQSLPDGRIMSGHEDKTIRIWTKGVDGEWSSEALRGHTDIVGCLQALPDGSIVSGSGDRTIRIWTKGAYGEWSSYALRGHTDYVRCLQALPDGRIVSGSHDGTIRIWTKTEDSPVRRMVRDWLPSLAVPKWESEILSGHTGLVYCLQVLPDGRIFSGSGDGTIRIWDGDEIAGGTS